MKTTIKGIMRGTIQRPAPGTVEIPVYFNLSHEGDLFYPAHGDELVDELRQKLMQPQTVYVLVDLDGNALNRVRAFASEEEAERQYNNTWAAILGHFDWTEEEREAYRLDGDADCYLEHVTIE